MITLFLIFYSFMAGKSFERAKTKARSMGFSERVWLASFFAAALWPFITWEDE